MIKLTYSILALAVLSCGVSGTKNLLYQKDFKHDDADGWKAGELNYDPENARVVNSALTISGRRMSYYAPGIDWQNYIVEFEARVDAWNSLEEGPWKRTGFRLLFRVRDGGTYYVLTVAESGLIVQGVSGGTNRDNADSTFIRNKVTSGTWWGSCLRPHKLGKFYKIRIIANGDEVTIFEDGKKAITCKFINDCIEKGSIGIGAVYAKGCIRKVRVTELPATEKKKTRSIFEEDE